MAVLDWLQQLLGGGPQPQGDLARIVDRPYSADQGYQQPEQLLPKQDQPHTWDEAVDAWYGLTGIPDIQKGWQTYQEGGDPLAAFGQAGAGALNAASLAFPALKAVPGLARTIGPLLGDEIGAVGGARRGSTPFIEQLLAEHRARTNALPLEGAQARVSTPPHIQSMDDVNRLAERQAEVALEGRVGKPWYDESGRAIYDYSGQQPDVAQAFTGAVSRTSPDTEVAGNATHALTMHSQGLVGDPIAAGRFPNAMGGDVEKYYYGAEPVSGIKIGPFQQAMAATWNPDYRHAWVNDFHNMRWHEFPGPEGAIYRDTPMPGTGELWKGTPSLGEHNFTRMMEPRVSGLLQEATGEPWAPQQTQAAGWTGIKRRVEGTSPEEAAYNFSDALRQNSAQISWESAPGPGTPQFREYMAMSPEDRVAYHDAVRSVLTDEYGRDVIPAHFGLLTGRTIDRPGFFKGQSAPGSQSIAAVGQAPGGFQMGIDPASREILKADSLVRGLLNRQEASAWHKPTFAASVDAPGKGNLIELNAGRAFTPDESEAIARAFHQASGSDFHSPIGTDQGVRFYNPEASGMSNRDFANAVREAAGHDIVPDVHMRHGFSDGGYWDNDWSVSPNGQDFVRELNTGVRPHLQRGAAELLATLGPKLAQIDRQFGFSPNPAHRLWSELGAYQREAVPNPARPWQLGYPAQRPAATDALSEILRKLGG